MRKRKLLAVSLAMTMIFSSFCFCSTYANSNEILDENTEITEENYVVKTVDEEETISALVESLNNEIVSSVNNAKIWDFSNDNISDDLKNSSDTGNEDTMVHINEDISQNGIVVKATPQKPVRIDKVSLSEGQIDNGYLSTIAHTYNTRLYLMGKGRNEYRNINFEVNGPTDIYVIAKSANESYSRELIMDTDLNTIYDESDSALGRHDFRMADICKFTYTANGTNTLYLATREDGLYIYYVAVVPRDLTTASTVRGWDFSESVFASNLPEYYIYNNVSSEDLTVMAKNNSWVKVVSTINNVNGFRYTQCLDLCGDGDRTLRNVTFLAQKNSDIYITARSSGNTDRTMIIRNAYGYAETTPLEITVTPEISTYKISNTDKTMRFMLHSESDGIRLYNIYIVPQSTSTSVNIANITASNINNGNDKTYSTLTSLGGLNIHASSSNKVYLRSNHGQRAFVATSSSPFFTKNGYFSFDVPNSTEHATQININAYAEGTTYLANKYGYVLAEIPSSNAYTTRTINYTGYSDTLYLYSLSTLSLANISVTNAYANTTAEYVYSQNDKNEEEIIEKTFEEILTKDVVASGSSIA